MELESLACVMCIGEPLLCRSTRRGAFKKGQGQACRNKRCRKRARPVAVIGRSDAKRSRHHLTAVWTSVSVATGASSVDSAVSDILHID
jgi:hypothetical protein